MEHLLVFVKGKLLQRKDQGSSNKSGKAYWILCWKWAELSLHSFLHIAYIPTAITDCFECYIKQMDSAVAVMEMVYSMWETADFD